MGKKKNEEDFTLFGELEDLMGLSLFGESTKDEKKNKTETVETDDEPNEEKNVKRSGRPVSPFNDAKPKGKKKPEKDDSNDDSDDDWPDDDDDE